MKTSLSPGPCVICGSQSVSRFRPVYLIRHDLPEGTDPKCHLARCDRCGSISVFPLPSEGTLARYYETYASLRGALGEQALDWSGRSVLPRIQNLAKELGGGRVLDIGCFDGGLLSLLPSSFEKYGLEVNEVSCQKARERGITVKSDPLESVDFSHRFDLILALDLLEHLRDPKAAVRRMSEMLAPGGYLLLQTGNAASLPARILREDWGYMVSLGHLHALTPRALRLVATELGMREIGLDRVRHSKGTLADNILRNLLAYGFHAFRRLYSVSRPLASRSSVLRRIYRHSPPRALCLDHMTYIGQKQI